jgi:putative hydrolase of the HAD superfamily
MQNQSEDGASDSLSPAGEGKGEGETRAADAIHAALDQFGRLPPVLLLDLDDTIVDDAGGSDTVERLWRAACLEAARARGLDADALYQAIDTCRTWYWNDPERHRVGRADIRAASAHIVDQSLRKLGVVDQTFARRISDDYRDRREAALCLFPGAREAIEAFVASGIRLALVTNGTAADQRGKIARFGLEQYFAHIQIEGEFGLGKPAPEVYLHVLAQLDAAAVDAWMVGDNLEWDVAAPQQLGIRGVWVDLAASGLPPDCGVCPDQIITALNQLLPIAPSV